jgi:hypothetical protein
MNQALQFKLAAQYLAHDDVRALAREQSDAHSVEDRSALRLAFPDGSTALVQWTQPTRIECRDEGGNPPPDMRLIEVTSDHVPLGKFFAAYTSSDPRRTFLTPYFTLAQGHELIASMHTPELWFDVMRRAFFAGSPARADDHVEFPLVAIEVHNKAVAAFAIGEGLWHWTARTDRCDVGALAPFAVQVLKGDDPHTRMPLFGFVHRGRFVTDPQRSDGPSVDVDPAAAYGISYTDAASLMRLNQVVLRAADEAVDAACMAVQQGLGIRRGLAASLHFSSRGEGYGIAKAMRDYIAVELQLHTSFQPPVH